MENMVLSRYYIKSINTMTLFISVIIPMHLSDFLPNLLLLFYGRMLYKFVWVNHLKEAGITMRQNLLYFYSVPLQPCWSHFCAEDFHLLVLNCRAFTGLNQNVGSHISVRWPFLFQWSVQMAAAGPQSAGTRLLQEIRAYCASVPGEVCDLCLMLSEVTWPQRPPQNAAHSWTQSLLQRSTLF